jgi:hypothetical protein
MKPHVSAITLGVSDLERAKQFYGAGLGWPIEQDYPNWVYFPLGGGSGLGLYPLETLAADSGAAPGDGVGGVVLNYLVSDEGRVADVLAEAEAAGGTIRKPAEQAPWGGTSGFFADPDGFVWKVASGPGGTHCAE